MNEPKIGELVRTNLAQLFQYCVQTDPEEIVKLSDKEYCNEVLGLGHAMLCTPAEAELLKQATGQSRYWAEVHHVSGHDVRVTSEWFERHRARFLVYLADLGLEPVGVDPRDVEAAIAALEAPKHSAASGKVAPGGARYRVHAVGNAQNALIRFVLGQLGHDSFNHKDWLAVKRHFGHCCVYCDGRRQLVIDHAVPISVDELGEHRLGNLVPACRDCNSAKGSKRYEDFLRQQQDPREAEARIAEIEGHMARHGYRPIADEHADTVRAILKDLRGRVADDALASIAAVNEIVGGGPSGR